MHENCILINNLLLSENSWPLPPATSGRGRLPGLGGADCRAGDGRRVVTVMAMAVGRVVAVRRAWHSQRGARSRPPLDGGVRDVGRGGGGLGAKAPSGRLAVGGLLQGRGGGERGGCHAGGRGEVCGRGGSLLHDGHAPLGGAQLHLIDLIGELQAEAPVNTDKQ